jgi:putative transport protein
MNAILENNPVFLLFLVISLGVLVGGLKIGGKSFGVSMVLFVGLFFGYLNPSYQLPEFILILGLSIFIYSIGLNTGPIFFKSYRQNGMRDIRFSFMIVLFTGLLAASMFYLLGFSAATVSGIFAGVSTNTPAFAAVLDYIQNIEGANAVATEDLVVSYTLAYPIGIIGSIVAIVLMEKILKVDYALEYKQLRNSYPLDNDLTSASVEITNDAIVGVPIRELAQQNDWNINFGRVKSGSKLSLSSWDTSFEKGDTVMILGAVEDIAAATSLLGKNSEDKISYDRREFDSRRIFMSNPKLAGRTIASLNLPEKFNSIITRIRRGDDDMLAQGNTILELGDRIRFIAKREDLKKLSDYFGDSYQASSRINLFSFGFGLSLGLLLGTLSISLGPDLQIKLGYAGGPLVVGLILGALRRTGPVLWTLPYSTSIVLQQLGLMFLLASIGVNNGSRFFESLSMDSIGILAAATTLCLLSGILILTIGYKWVKIPFSLLLGMVSNQPAVVSFASEKVGNKLPEIGYAMILPIALIMKIVVSQLLYIFLR